MQSKMIRGVGVHEFFTVSLLPKFDRMITFLLFCDGLGTIWNRFLLRTGKWLWDWVSSA
jgi:hypothetical protein